MNSQKEASHIVDAIFILTLFLVFLLSSLSVVGIGIKVYRSIVSDMNGNYDSRTASSYITEKIREADASGAVSIGTFHDADALILDKEIGDEHYTTYLYVYDGALYELFTNRGDDLTLNAGHPILDIQSFSFEEVSENLVHILVCTTEEQDISLYITTHSDPR